MYDVEARLDGLFAEGYEGYDRYSLVYTLRISRYLT